MGLEGIINQPHGEIIRFWKTDVTQCYSMLNFFKYLTLQSFHVINGDYETHSKQISTQMNLMYIQQILVILKLKTITFFADKKGTFEYYCTIHPEMKRIIEVI